jgi:hypothetical protein
MVFAPATTITLDLEKTCNGDESYSKSVASGKSPDIETTKLVHTLEYTVASTEVAVTTAKRSWV